MSEHPIVTLAYSASQAIKIHNLDAAVSVLNPARLLQHARHNRHARTPYSQHLRKKFLDELHFTRLNKVLDAQQPPTHPRFHGMTGIARGRLLSLCQQDLLMANEN